MPYSFKLIPYKGLKKKADVDVLISISDFFLARRVDCVFSKSGIKDVCGEYIIPDDALFLEEFFPFIPSMSMTYVNDKDTLESASYIVKLPHGNKWNGENVDFFAYKNMIEKKSNSFQIIYRAKNLHGQKIPYIRNFSSREEMKEYQIQALFEKTKEFELEGRICLEHAPTDLNYRHFELKSFDSQEKEIKYGKLSPYSKSRDKRTSKCGRDNFALYVLDNLLRVDFFINDLPKDESFLQDKDFFDESIPAEDREKNKALMQKKFKKANIEKKKIKQKLIDFLRIKQLRYLLLKLPIFNKKCF